MLRKTVGRGVRVLHTNQEGVGGGTVGKKTDKKL